ncbi:hypothetical protein [Pseudomonas sp. RA_105y_Pfl2_P56]|uniref:hypothetical protein n=1 Tax=Pseudomonas sp. RA_105y_Pfl2_P56 TaxID=3088701 RepID=UPI0030DA28B4
MGIPQGPMAVFGVGNTFEDGSGLYNHFWGDEPSSYNPVKDAFYQIPGGYGPAVYSGADLVFSAGAGFVKVPLKVVASDGLKSTSLFGVTVRQFDNNKFIPLTGIGLPYGSALGVYIGGVGGKCLTFIRRLAVRNKNIILRGVIFFGVIGFVWSAFLLVSLVVVFLLMAVLYLFFEPDFNVVFKWLGLPLSVLLSVRWIYKNFYKVKGYVEG